MISVKILRRVSNIFLITGVFLIPFFILEIIYGILYNSYVLLADSYHTIIDSLLAFLFYITLVKINIKSRRFPWGLYNLESLAILIASIFVVYLSANLVMNMLYYNKEGSIISSIPPWFSFIIFVSSIYSFVIYFIERKYRYLAIINNDMKHSLLDGFTEAIAGISLIEENKFLVIFVTLSIITFTITDLIKELKDSILSLLGASCNCPLKYHIINELISKKINVVNLYLRRLGSFYAVHVYIALPTDITLGKAYKIKRRVKNLISKYENVVLIDVRLIPLTEKKQKKILNQIYVPNSR
ncbi:MAG: cation transporter [Saccharolobus sp.]|uniref:cation transporter n=1 Tax=Saccharolobus sp. TaxID=2100761 RepID=UPI0028CEE84B|nr:cation transporter [Saccharolobus sp.]MDT7861563.1 cation transporter [Saccharolobus sp.]